MNNLTTNGTRDAPAGHPSSTPGAIPGQSKKARRKASMLKWRLAKEQERQRQEQPDDIAAAFGINLEGEEEDFYRLKNSERSKYPWNRPATKFPPRLRWSSAEAQKQEQWTREGLYSAKEDSSSSESAADAHRKPFILLDGPPYANGDIHLGHILNKTLKDAICKYKRMSGYEVEYRLGWDCHGLPIEKLLRADAEDFDGSEEDIASILRLLRKCKAHASKWVETQKKGFQKLGVLTDFDSAFRTYDPAYQASIVRAFAKFVEQGYIEHNLRPVPWCVGCKTVLAHAEISHQNIVDPSCFVFFPFADVPMVLSLFRLDASAEGKIEVGFLVWTTSPWSLPLNRGVAVNPSLAYSLLSIHNDSISCTQKLFVVARNSVDGLKLALAEGGFPSAVVTVLGQDVDAETLCRTVRNVGHPIMEGLQVPIVPHANVSVKVGTAILHIAPGCCEEDYILGKEHSLEVCCPIDENGRFTADVGIDGLTGLSVSEANTWALKHLEAKGYLILQAGELAHTSPHCWRCNSHLLFRQTKQWFINLDKNGLFERAQNEIKKSSVSFFPSKSKNPFLATLSSRPHEWCISRQRKWGVPIPAFICGCCTQGFTSAGFARKAADLLEHNGGIEFYWERIASCRSFAELLERFPVFERSDVTCPFCQHCAADDAGPSTADPDEPICFKKNGTRLEKDIFDVWFDSGVATFAQHHSAPADMVCEGIDQHRGWYQALLFCSLVLADCIPSSSFLTHAFVVDENKKKLSKSTTTLPNKGEEESAPGILRFHDSVVGRTPSDFCSDLLRLWACSSKYTANIVMSDELYRALRKKYMLLRHTTWFMLANLVDFTEEHQIPLEQLYPYDRFALSVLHRTALKTHQAYESHDFSAVCSILLDYVQKDLRPLYLMTTKARLYFEQPASPLRRSAQTTIFRILGMLSQLWAPILSYYAEQLNDELASKVQGGLPSVHRQQFRATEDPLVSRKDKCLWISLEKLRKMVVAEVEMKRKENVFSRNEYARVTIRLTLPAAAPAGPTKGGKKQGKALEGSSWDDDCTNIKAFLEDLPNDAERTYFMCSYLNVSQCELEFLAATPAPPSDDDAQQANDLAPLQNGKAKSRPAKAKAPRKATAASGAALKERLVLTVGHAHGTLCCRCDVYFLSGDLPDTSRSAEQPGEGGGTDTGKKILGLCPRCQGQLGK